MSVIFMDPPVKPHSRKGKKPNEATQAAIDSPDFWVVRAIRTDDRLSYSRLTGLGHSYKRNKSFGKNWAIAIRRMNKNNFNAAEYKSYGLKYSDIESDTVLVLFIKVTNEVS